MLRKFYVQIAKYGSFFGKMKWPKSLKNTVVDNHIDDKNHRKSTIAQVTNSLIIHFQSKTFD